MGANGTMVMRASSAGLKCCDSVGLIAVDHLVGVGRLVALVAAHAMICP